MNIIFPQELLFIGQYLTVQGTNYKSKDPYNFFDYNPKYTYNTKINRNQVIIQGCNYNPSTDGNT